MSRKKRKAGHREPNGRLSRRILHTKEREEALAACREVALADCEKNQPAEPTP